MTVKISFQIPKELHSNISTRKAIINCANYVRDLWLADAPHVSGEYARGLLQKDSVQIKAGEIIIQNLAPHAKWYEEGHRTFNIGLAILKNSKKAKTSKEGFKYLTFKMKEKGPTKFRSPSVKKNVTDAFRKTMPTGGRLAPIIRTYGGVSRYIARRRLAKPMMVKTGKSEWITISEKAIRRDPMKWQMPAMKGRKLAKKIKREAELHVRDMLRRVIEGERIRQLKTKGTKPSWYSYRTKLRPIRKSRIEVIR